MSTGNQITRSKVRKSCDEARWVDVWIGDRLWGICVEMPCVGRGKPTKATAWMYVPRWRAAVIDTCEQAGRRVMYRERVMFQCGADPDGVVAALSRYADTHKQAARLLLTEARNTRAVCFSAHWAARRGGGEVAA